MSHSCLSNIARLAIIPGVGYPRHWFTFHILDKVPPLDTLPLQLQEATEKEFWFQEELKNVAVSGFTTTLASGRLTLPEV